MSKLKIWGETTFLGKYELRRFSGSLWLKVFFHNMTNLVGFSDEKEAILCNEKDKYSILGELNSSLKQRDGKFEFIIEYPEKGIYNQWLQTNNPIDEVENSTKTYCEGFKSKHYGAPNNNWGGLARSAEGAERNTLLNGTPGRPGGMSWGFAIGMYQGISWVGNYNLPSNQGPVNIVYLWVKIPMNFMHTMRMRCTHSNYMSIFVVVFLLVIT